MARTVDKVKLKLELEGFSAIKSIGKDFEKFTSTVSITPKKLDSLLERLKKVNKTNQLSKTSFEGQIGVLTKLRNSVGIGTDAYDRLGREIDEVRAKMNALSASSKKQTGIFGRIGKGGRAALGGAVGRFLPPSAQIGGIAGFADSGMKGAVKGAGIGLAVDAVASGVQFARQAAIQASEVQKLEIALRGAVKTEADFKKGLEIIANTSKRLNVPIAASTKQFTTLAASVVGAGGSIEDAQVVFEGVSNSIKATGGNSEDVQSAIRAMSQIFGKGKVSAEELQGQLGERLAGAVVKFAEANGSSLQKLQKDLRDGTVGLDQVIQFAKKLNIDFAETAEKVANSSADAGQRLQTQINNFSIEVGKSIIPMGAAFQKMFSDILKGLQDNKGAMDVFIGSLKLIGGFAFATVASVRFLTRTLVDLAKILFHIANFQFKKAFETAQTGLRDTRENFTEDVKSMRAIFKGTQPVEGGANTSGSNTTTDGLPSLTEDQSKKAQAILDKYAESVRDVNSQIANSFVNTFKKLEDSLVEFVQTGAFNFKKLAQSIISDITRIFIRSQIIAPLTGGLGNIFGGGKSPVEKVSSVPDLTDAQKISRFTFANAKGNVFAGNKIVPYKMGGIVNSPHIFPMANGMGLMGEAGPESVMPLKRGRDGKLGVIATGGGVGNIVVNVDASGSSVEGDSAQSEQFGRALAAAIQSELIEQQRPGGLLT